MNCKHTIFNASPTAPNPDPGKTASAGAIIKYVNGKLISAKVIPMKKPGAGITPEMQKQLDALTPTEKKALAGAI